MLWKLLGKIDRRRIDPSVLVLTDEGKYGARIRDLGIPVVAMEMSRACPSPVALVRIGRAIESQRCNVVQGWMYHGNLAATLGERLSSRRVPVVWNVRMSINALRDQKPLTAMTIWLAGKLSGLPVRIVNNSMVSALAHEKRLGFPANKRVVIPNGFDLEVFRPSDEARTRVRGELGLDDDVPLVGLIARYDPMKDHANFLQAAAILSRSVPAVHLALAGPGVDEANRALTAAISALGLRGQTHLLGCREDVPSLIAGLDILALSSCRDEGFPNVVGEAMACGVPCVVTDVGESRSIVGPTGRVVPPRDPEAFAGGLRELIGIGPAQRRLLGSQARQRIMANFSLETVARKYEQLYEQVAKV